MITFWARTLALGNVRRKNTHDSIWCPFYFTKNALSIDLSLHFYCAKEASSSYTIASRFQHFFLLFIVTQDFLRHFRFSFLLYWQISFCSLTANGSRMFWHQKVDRWIEFFLLNKRWFIIRSAQRFDMILIAKVCKSTQWVASIKG